jgi:hypothetical protein
MPKWVWLFCLEAHLNEEEEFNFSAKAKELMDRIGVSLSEGVTSHDGGHVTLVEHGMTDAVSLISTAYYVGSVASGVIEENHAGVAEPLSFVILSQGADEDWTNGISPRHVAQHARENGVVTGPLVADHDRIFLLLKDPITAMEMAHAVLSIYYGAEAADALLCTPLATEILHKGYHKMDGSECHHDR